MSETMQRSNEPGASAVEVPAYMQRQTFVQRLRGDLSFVPVLLTMVALTTYFAITTGGDFLLPGNISNLFQQIVTTGIDALGVTLVLLLGEIDLSVAAVGTFSASVMGVMSERMGLPPVLAILLGLLAGAASGALNGFFIAVLRVPSFIVTLASSIFFTGALLMLLNHQETLIIHNQFIVGLAGPSSFLPDIVGVGLPTIVLILYAIGLVVEHLARRRGDLRTRPIGQLIAQIVFTAIIVEGAIALLENTPGPVPGTYLGVPINVAIFFGLIMILWLMLTKTRFGRHIYAVGGNKEATRRAGINVTFIQIAVFTLCSTIAAAGGILQASRGLGVASQVSPSLLLEAIAAAVIGGVSLFGGRGSVWSIVLGALIIGSLENGLDLRSQGSDIKQMIEGGVLIFAVTIDALVRRAQARSSSGR